LRPAELLDAILVNPLDDYAADHRAGDRGIAKQLAHDGLDCRRGRVLEAVSDPVAREDVSDLLAIGAPGGAVEGDVLGAAGLSLNRRQ